MFLSKSIGTPPLVGRKGSSRRQSKLPPTRTSTSTSTSAVSGSGSALQSKQVNSKPPLHQASMGQSGGRKNVSSTASTSTSTSSSSSSCCPTECQHDASFTWGNGEVDSGCNTAVVNASNTTRSSTPHFHLPRSSSRASTPLSMHMQGGSTPSPSPRLDMLVAVRIRPLNEREVQMGEKEAWVYEGESRTITQKIVGGTSKDHALTHSPPPLSFTYDYIYSPDVTNCDIFQHVGTNLVAQTMAGYHATLFCYGQTASGKTHTIHGMTIDPGMIALSVQNIFHEIEHNNPNREYVLRVAYFEVYCECINDLLNPSATNLSIRESGTKGIYINNLKEHVVVSADQVFALLSCGESQRHVGQTKVNDYSSRSHTIFQMVIESSSSSSVRGGECECDGEKGGEWDGRVRSSTLTMCDLAGSENAVKAGSRVKETHYINRSLLTLGVIIYKLSSSTTKNKEHIPYRDSKLTRLLQPSLSGEACISLICCLSPSSSAVEESISTLKFGARAKKIKQHVSINEVVDDSTLILRYREEIRKLKQELIAYKIKLSSISQPPSRPALDHEDEVVEQDVLNAQIEQLTRLILTSSSSQQQQQHRHRLPHNGDDIQQPSHHQSSYAHAPPSSTDADEDGPTVMPYVDLLNTSHSHRHAHAHSQSHSQFALSPPHVRHHSNPILSALLLQSTEWLPPALLPYYPPSWEALHGWTREQLEERYVGLLKTCTLSQLNTNTQNETLALSDTHPRFHSDDNHVPSTFPPLSTSPSLSSSDAQSVSVPSSSSPSSSSSSTSSSMPFASHPPLTSPDSDIVPSTAAIQPIEEDVSLPSTLGASPPLSVDIAVPHPLPHPHSHPTRKSSSSPLSLSFPSLSPTLLSATDLAFIHGDERVLRETNSLMLELEGLFQQLDAPTSMKHQHTASSVLQPV